MRRRTGIFRWLSILGSLIVILNLYAASIVVKVDSRTILKDFFRHREARPPIEEIVQGYNITGDPSWLLDFAIIGFPKCGTSSMMFHLQSHPEIAIFGDERCDLAFNQQAKLIADLYNELPAGSRYKRGIKCPMQLESTDLGMVNTRKFFPNTNYIVGIRHPVLWFESFYNFRIHNRFKMPKAELLIGKCMKGMWNVCTFRASFHIFLANLGKTNITDPHELQFVRKPWQSYVNPSKFQAKVFLYEVSQLSDEDPVREVKLLSDLQNFLGLKAPIDSIMWFKPGKNHSNPKLLKKVNSMKIDICEDRYSEVRRDLMRTAIDASHWIREFFVGAPDVVVPNPGHFKEILAKWERDPCLDRKK